MYWRCNFIVFYFYIMNIKMSTAAFGAASRIVSNPLIAYGNGFLQTIMPLPLNMIINTVFFILYFIFYIVLLRVTNLPILRKKGSKKTKVTWNIVWMSLVLALMTHFVLGTLIYGTLTMVMGKTMGSLF
jgi:hypothetical protein